MGVSSEGIVATVLGDAKTARAEMFSRLAEQELDHAFGLACLILADRDEAEDAVHDALESAWLGWDSLRDPMRFAAWFGRIVTNACRDVARRRRLAPITMTNLPEDSAPDEVALLPEREALRAALRELDVAHRTVLVLHFWEDLPIEEIARRVGERPGTVKSRLHYGLRTLRAALEAARRMEA